MLTDAAKSEVAKELTVAWIAKPSTSEIPGDATKAGDYVGNFYKAVLKAVKEGEEPAGKAKL